MSIFPEKTYNASSAQQNLNTILKSKDEYDFSCGGIQRQEQRDGNERCKFVEGIIDSIVKGFKIPPLVINEVISEGSVSQRVIDGSHRLRAILDFLDSKITVGFGSFNDLPPQDKIRLKRMSIDIITYTNLSEKEECEIFTKYNNVKPLTIGQHIRSLDNVIVHDLKSIEQTNMSDINEMGKRISNPTKDSFITHLAGIYNYLFKKDDAEGGKKCLKNISDISSQDEEEYISHKSVFQQSVSYGIQLFLENDVIKSTTQFKLIVIMLFKGFNKEHLKQALYNAIEHSETFGKARNNGSKKSIENMQREIARFWPE
jgi:hypothetical protein